MTTTIEGRGFPAGPRGPGPLAGILIAGALVRLALWAWGGGGPLHVWDERDYHAIATNLATRGEFALVAGKLTSLRPPLYPALVAVVYRLAGPDGPRSVHLIQAALSLVTVVITYHLAAGLYGRRVGLWAAALVCFYPSLLGYNNLLLTEVLFTTLLVAGCWAAVRAVRSRSMAGAAAAGALFALGALTRSVLWPSFVPIGLWLVASWRGGPAARVAATAAFLAAFAAVLAPWATRNTRLERTFQAVDCMGGRNLMMGNYEHTPLYRAWDAISLEGEKYWHDALVAEHPEARGLTQGQLDKVAMRAGLDYARRHPGLTLRRDLAKFLDFWGLERELIAGAAAGHYGRAPAPALVLLTLVIFGSYAAALIAGIYGAVVAPPADARAHALLLLIIGLLCAAHTATFGHPRYHLPIMPLVLTYAAGAAVNARAIWRLRGRPPFWVASALAAGLVAAWGYGIAGDDLGRYLELLRPSR